MAKLPISICRVPEWIYSALIVLSSREVHSTGSISFHVIVFRRFPKLNGVLHVKITTLGSPSQANVVPITPVEEMRVGVVVAMPTPMNVAMAAGARIMA